MPDFAGAKAAMRARLSDNWNAAPVVFGNRAKPQGWTAPWPPVDPEGILQPWVHFEIVNTSAEVVAGGTPGNRVWNYDGDILAHVFVPAGSGEDIATQHAVAIGELFRAAEFYNTVDGFCVRTLAPFVDGGGSGDDDGSWFRVSMSVGYTYWHRG